MATSKSLKGQWIDRGDGIKEFVVGGEMLTDGNEDDELILPSTQGEAPAMSTPPSSPSRSLTALPTPPASGSKRTAQLSGRVPKRPHVKYDYDLRVHDSQGRWQPRLAFRWWNANSQGHNSSDQLRAGLYKDLKSNIPPPFQDVKLQETLLSHLTPEEKLSPFISVFENFLPALHRALKSDIDAYISIIDFQQVEQSLRRRFPEASEVIWTIRKVIKTYGFNLRHHYKGPEWLVHGIIEASAIIQTIKVSTLRTFASTRRIPDMRNILNQISLQSHAYGLIKYLHFKHSNSSYRTGQLVGKVLDHIKIPDAYKALIANKVRNMMEFKHAKGSMLSTRGRSYLKGVYNPDYLDSDSESNGVDDFVVVESSEDESDSDAAYGEQNHDDTLLKRIVNSRKNDQRAAATSDDDDDDDNDDTTSSSSSSPSGNVDDEQALPIEQRRGNLRARRKATLAPRTVRTRNARIPKLGAAQLATSVLVKASSSTGIIDLTGDADDELEDGDDNEQALLDKPLHATKRKWQEAESARKKLWMSHVEVAKLTPTQLATFMPIQASSSPATIDLTEDAGDELEDDEVEDIEEAIWSEEEVEEDGFVVIASATRANRTTRLAIRSASARSTVGPRGLMRLEVDAAMERGELIQLD